MSSSIRPRVTSPPTRGSPAWTEASELHHRSEGRSCRAATPHVHPGILRLSQWHGICQAGPIPARSRSPWTGLSWMRSPTNYGGRLPRLPPKPSVRRIRPNRNVDAGGSRAHHLGRYRARPRVGAHPSDGADTDLATPGAGGRCGAVARHARTRTDPTMRFSAILV